VPVPCDRVCFFRLGQVMPVLPTGITCVRWRLCEQPQDGGATLWGGISCTQGFFTSLDRSRLVAQRGVALSGAALATAVNGLRKAAVDHREESNRRVLRCRPTGRERVLKTHVKG
jgi:hypothetical protein